MIGHYVNNLTMCEEDRLLLKHVGKLQLVARPRFGGAWSAYGSEPGCVLQVAEGHVFAGHDLSDGVTMTRTQERRAQLVDAVGTSYDELIHRFGAHRINAAIRARILTNRLWRTLSGSAVVQQEHA